MSEIISCRVNHLRWNVPLILFLKVAFDETCGVCYGYCSATRLLPGLKLPVPGTGSRSGYCHGTKDAAATSGARPRAWRGIFWARSESHAVKCTHELELRTYAVALSPCR